MSAESQWDVQQALKTKLDNHTPLTDLLANGASSILDHVPQKTPYPCITISDTTSRSWDTMQDNGFQQEIMIHSWSRARGMKEIKQIMGAVYNALHRQSLVIPDQTLVLAQFVFGETRLSGDNLTRLGIQQFLIITDPTS